MQFLDTRQSLINHLKGVTYLVPQQPLLTIFGAHMLVLYFQHMNGKLIGGAVALPSPHETATVS